MMPRFASDAVAGRPVQVGVVIPTLNSAHTLEWTLLSLLRQEGCEVRLVVADSNSSDGTLEICAKWNVSVIQVPAGNMYHAINAGLQTFDTEWVGYLNSDDILYLDGLRRLVKAATQADADVAYGGCDYLDPSGRFLYALTPAAPAYLRALFRRGILPMAQPATIIRRSLALRLGGFSEQFRYAADYDFFARAEASQARFVRLGRPGVAGFRLDDSQLSARGAASVTKEVSEIRAAIPKGSMWSGVAAELHWRMENLDQTIVALLHAKTLRRRGHGGKR